MRASYMFTDDVVTFQHYLSFHVEIVYIYILDLIFNS